MAGTWHRYTFSVSLMAVVTAIGLLANLPVGAAQSSREADGARLLKGAIDLHFHMDPWTPGALNGQAGIADVRVARSRGMRGLVIKDHNEPTAPLAYHLRQDMPGLELYGGFVLNLPNGGINPAGVGEKEVRESKNPNRPFVAVSRNGELTPEVKQVISIIAKHGLVLASGHIASEEALMVFREAKRQGVQHMIATHAFDLAGKMTLEQMREAAKLGAFIEFDFRNTLEGGRTGVGAFAEAIRAHGFTDTELDLLFKENPAKALGLTPIP